MVARRGWDPALFLDVSGMDGQHAPPTGDHESPPNPASSTLAPTDGDGLFLMMPIGVPLRMPSGNIVAILSGGTK